MAGLMQARCFRTLQTLPLLPPPFPNTRTSFFELGSLFGLPNKQLEKIFQKRCNHTHQLAARVHQEPHRSLWLSLPLSQEVKQMVVEGVTWSWKGQGPPHRRILLRRFTPTEAEREAVTQLLREYHQLGAVEEVKHPEHLHWSSPIFGRPKVGSTKWRLIADLSVLNKHIQQQHFKMESLQTALLLSPQNVWYAKLDLSNAYFHLGINPNLTQFLGLQWEGRWWKWTALPFGLSVAPRLFTKLMRQAIKHIRRMGIQVVIYLDDLLILAPTPHLARLHVVAVAWFLHKLGLTINWDKSILTPSQLIEFLGFLLNSRTQTVSVTREKVRKIIHEVNQWLHQHETTPLPSRVPAHKLASLVGSLSALRPSVECAFLHLRQLDICKTTGVSEEGWEGTCTLTPQALEELRWWRDNLPTHNGTCWRQSAPTWELTTDAAHQGWGATLQRLVPLSTRSHLHPSLPRLNHCERPTPRPLLPPTTSLQLHVPSPGHTPHIPHVPQVGAETHPPLMTTGTLIPVRETWHEDDLRVASINRLELEAGIRALRTLAPHVRGTTVRWRTDNQVTMYCVAKWKGKSEEMRQGTQQLWELCQTLRVKLIPQYLPGEENTVADELSRRVERQDWMLNPLLFQRICKLRYRPNVDAFASRRNRQVPQFWSWVWEPGCSAIDFFAQPLKGHRLWCNPPFSMITRVLQQIRDQRAETLLIVPMWVEAPWWAPATLMQVSPPLLLPRVADLFLPASTRNTEGVGQPLWETLCLHVSGDQAQLTEARQWWGNSLNTPDTQLLRWWDSAQARHQRQVQLQQQQQLQPEQALQHGQ